MNSSGLSFFFFKQKTAYEILAWTGVQTCALPIYRMQAVLLSEAMRLVGGGYVSAEDLDKTIKDGLGLRWSFLGPFETIELNAPGGIPDYCARYTGFYRRVSENPPSPTVWDAENVARILLAWGDTPSREALAEKSASRDRRLAALKTHKRNQTT